MKRKLFSLLVLLLVAVSSAWADATIAKLWVGNSEEVTSEGTITGTGATEGTASVAIENGSMVLTLNNFKFNGCGYNDSGIYYQSNTNGNTPLIIKIEGNNEITLPGADKSLYGFYLYGGNGDHVFTITGSGSLTVTVGDGNLSNGIYVQQADLVLAGGTVTANVGNAGAEFKSLGVSVPQGTLTIDGGTLKASGSTTSASRGVNVNNNVTIKSGELEAYGYTKGIKNSGGDALVFAEGVTPTLFKAGENEASATDVSKYEDQKYLHVVCTGGAEPATPAGDGEFTLSVGTSEHGTVTFKVGENTVTTAQEGQTVTVEITPATGWVVNQPSGQWYAAVAAARSAVPMLNGFELTKSTTAENTWSFVMQRANAEISVTYKKLLTNQDITVQDITALTYTGQAQEPVVTVKDGSTVLTKDVDYTVTYSNNTNAALSTAAQNAPTVTITAVATSEKYAGETTKKFTINKKALTVTADNKQVTFGDDAPTYTESYDGFVNNETKAVLGGTLALTCDYVKNQSGEGNYDITPSGYTSSNYDITFTKGTLTVGKKALEDGFIADIASLVYNGVAQEPAPVVTFNGMTLVKGTDYSVSYENNVNVGTATATVTALANSTKYSGTASKTFSITKKALTVKADNKSVTFGDAAPQYTVSYDGFAAQENKDVLGGTLAFACDYVKNTTAAGTYDITPSGLTSSNYAITFTKGTLTVGKKALENDFIAAINALIYTSEALEPAPVVTFNGMTLVKGTDYTVSYSNNVNVGTATVTVTAVSTNAKYSGTAQKTFVINPATLTGMTLAQKEFTYNFTDPQLQTATAAEVKAGNLIVPATDYDITDNTATELGTYTAKVTGKNNFTGSVTADFTIVKEEMGVEAEETESGKEVDDVTMTVSVVDRSQKQLTLDVVNVPDGKDVIVEIPAQINGWDVIGIADGAVNNNVTDVYMPNTGETAINVTDAAMGLATVHVDIQLLDNYAKMLPTHVGKKKVVSEVTQTAKRFWSFSCGVDVELPAGVTANIVKANTDNQVTSEPIKENVVKANNGVLLEGEQGVEYQITALPATSVGNDYAGNLLEPVIEKKHYGYGQGYYILKDGKFYAIANDAAEVPSCKAVLHIAGANARVIDLISFDETTGISGISGNTGISGAWYDLNGRKLQSIPTKKGVYIMNGKKVVIK